MFDHSRESHLEAYARWLKRLASRDPALFADLSERMQKRQLEFRAAPATAAAAAGMVSEAPSDEAIDQFVAETLVREGRPALMVQGNAITFPALEADSVSRPIIETLTASALVLQPLLPLVGRIDVANYPGNLPFLGTGWLVAPGVLVTNRHVAELMARADGQQFVFKPGRFGEKLQVAVDYRHEYASGEAAMARIKRVMWIEPDAKKADIAFVEVEAANDGTRRGHFDLAEQDAADADPVAVIGYPARAPANIIPDQAWMDRVYGSTYEIKRIAPGLMGPLSRGWATHDCTTLGGNSGSVVVSMKTGKAVALHFAGLYMIENYAVPASTIRRYLREAPWSGSSAPPPPPRPPAPPEHPPAAQPPGNREVKRTLSFNIPVRIDVSLGSIELGEPGVQIGPIVDTASQAAGSNPEAAAIALSQSLAGETGVLSVRPGALISSGLLTSEVGMVVAAHPELVAELAAKVPDTFRGLRVVVQPASLRDQLGLAQDAPETEAVSSIAYNDEDRKGAGFSFNWLSNEQMEITAHVGPERSWPMLKAFISGATDRLVSSMYEFHANHIAQTVSASLDSGVAMKLVLARQSRNPGSGQIAKGDFNRAEVFELWRNQHAGKFENVYVPIGKSGLVANSYHIKVTVRDEDDVWLSSGNWKRASQPLIAEADLNNPKKTSAAGNREWHITLRNKTLAERFRNHILEDLRVSQDELGGTPEAVGDEVLVDVPLLATESIELEAPADRVFEPLVIGPRIVRVKPLLTPDKQGKVFTDAVLSLIESAQHQLVFQNQYIGFAGVKKGNLKVLVDALCKKSKTLEDCRIILRSGGDGFADDMRALQLNGLDVNRCVRRLANTHTKGIVVDGKRVLVGSQNWSSDGVSLNRDASLLFDDAEIAQYFLNVFEVDWKRASELRIDELAAEAAPRLAVGPEAPAGFERMTLAEYLDR